MDNLEKHLSELYDRQTVEEGRELERSLARPVSEPADNLTPEERARGERIVRELSLYSFKGERYAGKAEAVRQGLIRERERSEKLNRSVAPADIRCLLCEIAMRATDSALENRVETGGMKERVLFFFLCPRCQKVRAFWEDRKEWESPVDKCPRCGSMLDSHQRRDGNIISTKYECQACSYQSENILDLDKSVKTDTAEPEFEKDRARFVLSEKAGQEYVTLIRDIKALRDLMQEKQIEEKKRKVKQLTVAELAQSINPAIEKRGYSALMFGATEIHRLASIEFTAHDNIAGRKEYESRVTLKKIIETALLGTNWHLMSEGLSYRLGILTGRLRENSEEPGLKLNDTATTFDKEWKL